MANMRTPLFISSFSSKTPFSSLKNFKISPVDKIVKTDEHILSKESVSAPQSQHTAVSQSAQKIKSQPKADLNPKTDLVRLSKLKLLAQLNLRSQDVHKPEPKIEKIPQPQNNVNPYTRDSGLSADQQKIKASRTQKYESTTIREERSGYTKRIYNHELAQRSEKRRQARVGYAKRIAEKGPKSITNPNVCKEASPEQRLHMYNRRHKCNCHHLRFNTVNEKDGTFVFGCDRTMKPYRPFVGCTLRCNHCGNQTRSTTRVACDCKVLQCIHCLYETYEYNGNTDIHCHCEYVDATPQILDHLTKTVKTKVDGWKNRKDRNDFFKSLKGITPKAYKPSDEDFPEFMAHGGSISVVKDSGRAFLEAILTPIRNVIHKMKSAYRAITDFLLNAQYIGTALEKLSMWFGMLLDHLADAGTVLIEWVTENALLMPMVLQNLYNFLFGGFKTSKMSWLSISSLFIHVFWETEIVDKFKDIVDESVLPPLMHAFSKVMTWFDKDEPQQQGSNLDDDFLVHAGPAKLEEFWNTLTKYLSRKLSITFVSSTLLAGLRNFNTIMMSCKNVGSLIEKFIEHLPNFFKCLVKASDTRYYLTSQLRKPETPLAKFSASGLAIALARTSDASDDELAALQLEFQVCERLLLVHMTENHIPLDQETVRFMDHIKKYTMLPGTIGKKLVEPFVIRITGDAGVGKSTLSMPILSAIDTNLKTEQALKDVTYFRNPMVPAWDGCTAKHRFCVYDDFGQDREETDLREMITLCSRNMFLAPFSSIDPNDRNTTGIKGNVVNFEAMVLNSNVTEIQPLTLNSKEAINRRRHIMFEVRFVDPSNKVVKSDYSHAKFVRLGTRNSSDNGFNPVKDYQPIWAENGMTGFRRMQREIRKEYETHLQRSQNIKINVQDLFFTEKSVPQDELNTMRANAWQSPIKTLGDFMAHTGSIDYYVETARDLLSCIATGALYTAYAWMVSTYLVTLFSRGSKIAIFIYSIVSIFLGLSLFLSMRTYFQADSGENRNKAHIQRVVAHSGSDVSRAEANSGPVLHKDVFDKFATNTFTIEVDHGTGKVFVNGCFLKGTIALIPKHIFYNWVKGGSNFIPEGTEILIHCTGSTQPIVVAFESKRLMEVSFDKADRDLCLYFFPPQMQARPTIVHHVWDGTTEVQGRRMVSMQQNYNTMRMYCGKVTLDHIEVSPGFKKNGDVVKIKQHACMKVSTPSVEGKCGSLTCIDDDLMPQKIVGINIGGRPGCDSTTLIITRHNLEFHIDLLEKQVGSINFTRPELAQSGWKPASYNDVIQSGLEGQFCVIAKSSYTAFPSGKSKIRKSPIYDKVFKATTAPCVIDVRDKDAGGMNIILQKMNKYGVPSGSLPPRYLEIAAKSVIKDLRAIPSIRLKRTLTTEEAINGIVTMPYIDSLDLTTSPGYPFIQMGIKGEKRSLMEGEVGSYYPSELLQKHIDIVEERLARGELPDYVYTNALKDERKDVADVAKGKVRMFSMNNAALSIVMRKLFLPVVAHAYQCRFKSFLSIGIDKTSPEWDQFVRYLLEVGSDFYDMDYKGFDTRASLTTRLAVNEFFIEDWMDDRTKLMARTVLQYDSQSVHQYLDYIILLMSGTSSGSILTALVGSLINETYIRTAWMGIMASTALMDLKYYKKYTRTKNYGDDLVLSVDASIKEKFNDSSISTYLSQFGIEITPGDKTDSWGSKGPCEFTFLRHKSRLWLGRWVPLMKDPLEQINWIRIGSKAEEPEVACENNCNSALRAVFFYGSEEFEKARNKILEVRPNYELISFEPMFQQFQQYGYVCDVEGSHTFGSARMGVDAMLNFFQNKELLIDDDEFVAHSSFKPTMDMKQTQTTPIPTHTPDTPLGWLEMSVRCSPHSTYCVFLEYLDNLEMDEALKNSLLAKAHWFKKTNFTFNRLTKRQQLSANEFYQFMKDNAAPYQQYFYEREKSPEADFERKLYAGIIDIRTLKDDDFIAHSGGEPHLDQPVLVQENESGVILSKQEEPKIITRVENRSVVPNNRAEKYNNDMTWTLETMLKRNNLIETVSWPSTAPLGTPIRIYDVVQDILLNDISVTPFKRFERFRCNFINIKVEVIANRFALGRLWLVWRPTMLPKDELRLGYLNVWESCTLPHISLDPNSGTEGILKIPFVYNRQYMDLVNGDSLGQLYLMPVVPFTPGTGSTAAATVKLYVAIDGAEFKQPRTGATMRLNQYGASVDDEFIVHSGIVDTLINAGTKGLEGLIDKINPDQIIGDAMGALLDKPQLTENMQPLTMKEQGYMSNTANIDYVEYLSAKPGAQQLTDSDIYGTTVDEMSIREILNKPVLVDIISWKSTDVVGTQLYTDQVGPMSKFPISKNPSVPTPISTLDLMAKLHAYWSGSIRYIFEFVNTQFHEGKIDINYHPALSPESVAHLSPDNSVTQYSLSHFMRNAQNIVVVDCPYLGDTPYRKVWRGQPITDTYAVHDTKLRYTDYFSGTLQVRVSTQLNAPTNVVPDISILVYKIAGDDFTFALNTLTGSSIQLVNEIPTDFIAHSGSVPDRNTPMHTWAGTMLSAGQGTWSDVQNQQFGETSSSLRELCKKYQRCYRNAITLDTTLMTPEQINGSEPVLIPLIISNFFGIGGTGQQSNFLSFCASMFRMFRGSLVFKYRVRFYSTAKSGTGYMPVDVRSYVSPMESQVVDHYSAESTDIFPSDSNDTFRVGQPISLGYASNRQNAEFKVPFMTNRSATLCRNNFDSYEGTSGFNKENYDTQALVFANYFEGIPISEAARGSHDFVFVMELDIAFADEASFGVWIGHPDAYIMTQTANPLKAVGPDEWVYTAPPLLSARKTQRQIQINR